MAKTQRPRSQLIGKLEASDCSVDGEHLNKIDRRLRRKHKGGQLTVNWTARKVYFSPPR